MVKKRIAIIFGIIALIAIISSGTITFFTAESSATNVITTGKVVIDLIETSKDEDGVEVPFEDVDGVMPGATVSKIVTVRNDGNVDSYVRVAVDKKLVLLDGEADEVTDTDGIIIDFNTEKWTEKDGFWYYNDPLAPGEESEPLFTSVTFSEELGNEYQEHKLLINVHAQATQVRNNGTCALDAEFPEGGEVE